MALATVPQQPQTHKPPKAFYAHLYDEADILTKVEGTIYFMVPETGSILVIEPEMCSFLVALGEIGLSETQRVMDQLHHGLPVVAITRRQEVQ